MLADTVVNDKTCPLFLGRLVI